MLGVNMNYRKIFYIQLFLFMITICSYASWGDYFDVTMKNYYNLYIDENKGVAWLLSIFDERITEMEKYISGKKKGSRTKDEERNKLKEEINGKLNKNNDTPFYLEVVYEDINLINKMIKYGADVNQQTVYSRSPLLYILSGKKQNAEIASILIKAGADVNCKDKNGKSPLFYALCQENPNIEIVKALVESGADCDYDWQSDASVKQGLTPLMKAMDSRNTSIIETILFKSSIATINARYVSEDDDGNKYETTPLGQLTGTQGDTIKRNRNF